MEHSEQEQPTAPFASVKDNIAFIRQSLGSPADLLIRTFLTADGEKRQLHASKAWSISRLFKIRSSAS